MHIKTFTGTIDSIQTTQKPVIRHAPKAVQSSLHTTAYYICLYIIIQVRQKTQQYLQISMLVNIYGYMFRLILS
jgi:hypothetical protein